MLALRFVLRIFGLDEEKLCEGLGTNCGVDKGFELER